MAAKYILALLSVLFLFAAGRRRMRNRQPHPQTRTWLIVAVIFAAVSVWLFARG